MRLVLSSKQFSVKIGITKWKCPLSLVVLVLLWISKQDRTSVLKKNFSVPPQCQHWLCYCLSHTSLSSHLCMCTVFLPVLLFRQKSTIHTIVGWCRIIKAMHTSVNITNESKSHAFCCVDVCERTVLAYIIYSRY